MRLSELVLIDKSPEVPNTWEFLPGYGRRKRVYLQQTNGEVIILSEELPSILRKPLMGFEEATYLRGWNSGKRSALLSIGKKWYKLKGIYPSSTPHLDPLQPSGCMRESFILKELEVSERLAEYGRNEDILPPLEPLGFYRYNLKFLDENVGCCLFKTRGDSRLAEYLPRVLRILYRLHNKGKKDLSKLKTELTDKIGKWLGFWLRGLKKNETTWGTVFAKDGEKIKVYNTNVHPLNMVLYCVEDGVGVGLIDFDLSISKKDKISIQPFYKKLGIVEVNFERILNYEEKEIRKYLRNLGLELYIIENINEKLDFYTEIPYSKLNEVKDKDMEVLKAFEDGLKGKELPEPININFFKKLSYVKNFVK